MSSQCGYQRQSGTGSRMLCRAPVLRSVQSITQRAEGFIDNIPDGFREEVSSRPMTEEIPPLSGFCAIHNTIRRDDEKNSGPDKRSSTAGCGFREEGSRYLVGIQEVESQDQANHFQASSQGYVEPDARPWMNSVFARIVHIFVDSFHDPRR
jgi:hypothetical protein